MSKLLRVGAETFDLGPPAIMEGLFATISYRLEPDGRGSRFPIVMNRLYAGRLGPADLSAACRELEEIETGLASLPSDRAVWSFSDLRRRDDSRLPVNHAARNVRDYFVAGDGRPLVTVLRDATRRSQDRNEHVELASSEVRGKTRGAWTLLIGGFLWTVVGYLFLPHWIFASMSDSSPSTGPLIWPAGIFVFGGGVVQLAMLRHPAIEDWFQRRIWLAVLLILAACGLYFWMAWT
jgi:hypothetical protein